MSVIFGPNSRNAPFDAHHQNLRPNLNFQFLEPALFLQARITLISTVDEELPEFAFVNATLDIMQLENNLSDTGGLREVLLSKVGEN